MKTYEKDDNFICVLCTSLSEDEETLTSNGNLSKRSEDDLTKSLEDDLTKSSEDDLTKFQKMI